MRFKLFAVLIAVAVLPSVRAVADPVKIGLMTSGPMPAVAAMGNGIAGALAQLGLVRDRDFAFELRAGEGKAERLPALAKQLVDARVAMIVTSGYAVPLRNQPEDRRRDRSDTPAAAPRAGG
jgi:ABC-type uncharacterized transport system substrate-binding protein